MNAKFRNYYYSRNGNMVFVYEVSGTEKELKAYGEAQGDNLRHIDDDTSQSPLYFAMNPLTEKVSESVPLIITTNGRVVADDAKRVFAERALLNREVAKQKAKIMARQALLGAGNPLKSLSAATATRTVEDIVVETAPAEVVEEAIEVDTTDDIPT